MAMQTNANAQHDLDTLTALNRDFFASVQKGDVQRFEEILADDFMSSHPDGSLLDKAEFLKLTAQPVTISGLVAENVRIRLLGDFAIIHGRFDSRFADGKPRRGRYTDNWARRDGAWVAVSAHFNLDRDG
jgi:ketosteroid isomerase-like protein